MKVVICGGGFAGTKLALSLANKPGIDVRLLVNKENFEYQGALYSVATGGSALSVVIPHRETFAKASNVEVVLEELISIDHFRKFVHGKDGDTYQYDALVLALGNVLDTSAIPGVAKHALSMNSVKDAVVLRQQLSLHLGQSSDVPARVVIIGGGASGVELAGSIKLFADKIAKEQKLKAPRTVKVDLVEHAPHILPKVNAKLAHKVSARLEKLGVEVLVNCQVKSCNQGEVVLDSRTLQADVIVNTVGSMLPAIYLKHPGLFDVASGRVSVDDYLQPNGHENIFVLGDNNDTKHTGYAWAALHQAIVTSKNIMRLQKDRPMDKYIPYPPTYVVPVGKGWALFSDSRRSLVGKRGWLARRKANLMIYEAFMPYKKAVKKLKKQ